MFRIMRCGVGVSFTEMIQILVLEIVTGPTRSDQELFMLNAVCYMLRHPNPGTQLFANTASSASD